MRVKSGDGRDGRELGVSPAALRLAPGDDAATKKPKKKTVQRKK
jgi:hypothetical protein